MDLGRAGYSTKVPVALWSNMPSSLAAALLAAMGDVSQAVRRLRESIVTILTTVGPKTVLKKRDLASRVAYEIADLESGRRRLQIRVSIVRNIRMKERRQVSSLML
jgi:hypothetical protein